MMKRFANAPEPSASAGISFVIMMKRVCSLPCQNEVFFRLTLIVSSPEMDSSRSVTAALSVR